VGLAEGDQLCAEVVLCSGHKISAEQGAQGAYVDGKPLHWRTQNGSRLATMGRRANKFCKPACKLPPDLWN
jgi:hypothetical protein